MRIDTDEKRKYKVIITLYTGERIVGYVRAWSGRVAADIARSCYKSAIIHVVGM